MYCTADTINIAHAKEKWLCNINSCREHDKRNVTPYNNDVVCVARVHLNQ